MVRKKTDEVEETPAETAEVAVEEMAVEAAAETEARIEAAAEEAAPEAVVEEKPKKKATAKPAKAEKQIAEDGTTEEKKVHKRAEKVGIVSSDKMMKTVTVRVDRLVKHPVYRKYVRKRKKFMAHDDLGAKIGDKVKIVETRPLSARNVVGSAILDSFTKGMVATAAAPRDARNSLTSAKPPGTSPALILASATISITSAKRNNCSWFL